MHYHLSCLIALFGVLSGFNALPIQQNAHRTDIIEGDILMTESLKQFKITERHHRTRRGITTDLIKRWPKNTVPYVIDASLGKLARRAIRHAIRQYHQHTCLQFVRRTDEKDYVAFQRDIGCYSPIGRQGGRQKLAVGDGCEEKGTIMHELMHALGFLHEHSRHDRDEHVKILWWNIEPDFFKNFEIYSPERIDTQDIPYDYGSLMHYDRLAFSKNRQNTIEALDNPDRKLGQMEKFSHGDIQKISKAYNCPSIDKDPLPAQPVKSRLVSTEKKLAKKKSHINEMVEGLSKQLPEKFEQKSQERKINLELGPSEKIPPSTDPHTSKHRVPKPQSLKANKLISTKKIKTRDISEEELTKIKKSKMIIEGNCKDLYPVRCKQFASFHGYCQHWNSFMKKTCPKACGFCR